MDDGKTHVTPWPFVGATCKRDDNSGSQNEAKKGSLKAKADASKT
jgi:hypothetical protein